MDKDTWLVLFLIAVIGFGSAIVLSIKDSDNYVMPDDDRFYDLAIEYGYFPEECADDYGYIKYEDLVKDLVKNKQYEALEVIEDLYGYME